MQIARERCGAQRDHVRTCILDTYLCMDVCVYIYIYRERERDTEREREREREITMIRIFASTHYCYYQCYDFERVRRGAQRDRSSSSSCCCCCCSIH